jgi:hypothetical protein
MPTSDENGQAPAPAAGEPSNADLVSRVDGIESRLDTIMSMLGGAEHGARDAAQQQTESRLDRPSSVADEIRRQLDEQRAADNAAEAARTHSERLATVESRLEGMSEVTPEPPQRRVEKIMWGAR